MIDEDDAVDVGDLVYMRTKTARNGRPQDHASKKRRGFSSTSSYA